MCLFRTSLAIQWLGLHFQCRGGSLVRKLRSHMLCITAEKIKKLANKRYGSFLLNEIYFLAPRRVIQQLKSQWLSVQDLK